MLSFGAAKALLWSGEINQLDHFLLRRVVIIHFLHRPPSPPPKFESIHCGQRLQYIGARILSNIFPKIHLMRQ